MLYVYLLGPFRATGPGQADLAFPTRSTAAVLALLAMRPGRRFSRVTLAQSLWPDREADRSASNLRQVLWRLRSVLGAESDLLTITRSEVWLQPSPDLWTDLEAFLQSGGPDLIRGPLLEGWNDEWVLEAREALQEPLIRRLAAAAADALKEGRPADALMLGRRLLTMDPLREEGHRAVMAAHMALGETAAALQQYRTCQALLAEELGVAPAPETQALAAEARAVARAVGVGGAVIPLPDALEVGPDSSLVGRSQELRRLAQVVAGQGPRLAVLLGEPGIGKTTLLTAVAAMARAAGMRVLTAAGQDGPSPPPYQLVADLLREAGSGWLRQLPAGVASALTLILPELGPPTRTTPGEDRHRLLSAIGEAIRTLSADVPLLLALEDIQWSDPASVAALELIWPRLDSQNSRLVAACRLDALSEREDIRTWIQRQEAREQLVQLRLEGLDRGDTAALVNRLEPDSSPLFLTWLHRETGGNPLFIRELVRAARNRPEAPPPELPPGIQRVMRGRLVSLPEEALQVLRGAAVLGEHFSPEELRLILDLPEEGLVVQLEDLITRGLLVEMDSGCRFFHARFREAVLGDLALARRKALHRRAARVVRAPAAAAYHALEGEDWPLAAIRLLDAAQEAMAVGALEHAIELLGKASEAARRSPDGELQAVTALLQQERALGFLVRPEQQSRVLDQLQQLAEQRGDVALAVRVSARRAMMLSRDGRLDAADAEGERALALARRPGIPPERLAEALLQLAHLDFVRGRLRRSARLSREALENACMAGSLFWEGRALRRVAESDHAASRYESMRLRAQGALDIARRLGDVPLEISALRHLIPYALRRGDVEQAFAIAHRRVELSQRIGYQLEEAYACCVMSETCRLAGRPELGDPWVQRAMLLIGDLREPMSTFWACREQAWQCLSRGNYHEALRQVHQGLVAVRQLGSALYSFQLNAVGVRAYLALGETAEAVAWSREQHPASLGQVPTANLETCVLATRTWLAVGDLEQARRWGRWLSRWRRYMGANCFGPLVDEAGEAERAVEDLNRRGRWGEKTPK